MLENVAADKGPPQYSTVFRLRQKLFQDAAVIAGVSASKTTVVVAI